MAESKVNAKRTLNAYISGFILSIALTLAAYLLVQAHLGSGKQLLSQPVILGVILVFAIAQLIVQMLYFLHLGEEKQPRWRLLTLIFTVVAVLIVVIGSLWIMVNLNYHHEPTSPDEVNQYLKSQDSL